MVKKNQMFVYLYVQQDIHIYLCMEEKINEKLFKQNRFHEFEI